MTAAPTADAPTAAGGKPATTRRQSAALECWLLAHGAGRQFRLRTTAGGQCYLSDVPNPGDAALLSAGRDLALLARPDLL